MLGSRLHLGGVLASAEGADTGKLLFCPLPRLSQRCGLLTPLAPEQLLNRISRVGTLFSVHDGD